MSRGSTPRVFIDCAVVRCRWPLSVVPRSNAAGLYRLCRSSTPPASIGCAAVPCCWPLSVVPRPSAAGLYRLCRGSMPPASIGCAVPLTMLAGVGNSSINRQQALLNQQMQLVAKIADYARVKIMSLFSKSSRYNLKVGLGYGRYRTSLARASRNVQRASPVPLDVDRCPHRTVMRLTVDGIIHKTPGQAERWQSG